MSTNNSGSLPTIESLESIDDMTPGTTAATTDETSTTSGPNTYPGSAYPTQDDLASQNDEDSSEDELMMSSRSTLRSQPATGLPTGKSTGKVTWNDSTEPTNIQTKASSDSLGDMNFLEEDHDPNVKQNGVSDSESDDEPPRMNNSSSTVDPRPRPPGHLELTNSLYATSPARAVPRSPAAQEPDAPMRSVVGSYKGRAFGMPVVSDELHARALRMGDVNSFVGSVRGASGIDESDVLSFRASVRGGFGSLRGPPPAPRGTSSSLVDRGASNRGLPSSRGRGLTLSERFAVEEEIAEDDAGRR